VGDRLVRERQQTLNARGGGGDVLISWIAGGGGEILILKLDGEGNGTDKGGKGSADGLDGRGGGGREEFFVARERGVLSLDQGKGCFLKNCHPGGGRGVADQFVFA